MKNFRNTAFTIMLAFFIIVGAAVLGAMGRMVKLGRLEPKTLSAAVLVFVMILAFTLIVTVSMFIHRYKQQLSKPKSSDILADIIKLGEDEKIHSAKNNENKP